MLLNPSVFTLHCACACVNRGVLDGLLESYPWRGPLSLDLKPFALQLQGIEVTFTRPTFAAHYYLYDLM